MARVPMRRRGAAKTQGRMAATAGEVQEYFILDKNMREVHGRKIEPGAKTISLSARDAAFYIANGAIGTADPAKDDAAKAAVAHHQGKLGSAEKEAARDARQEQREAIKKADR